MTKDNVIIFPTDRIVNKQNIVVDKKEVKKQYDKIHKQQTQAFVETAVDDIAVMFLRALLDLDCKINSPQFTRDLALMIDVLRGLIYRDFGEKYPSQQLVDELVSLYDDRNLGPSAKVDYTRIFQNIKNSKKKNVFSDELSKDLKDADDDITFEPDFDV